MASSKLNEGDQLMKKADKMTKLTFFKWSADWSGAVALYEQAATAFKLAKQPEKAKEAYEKAAEGHERLSSPWQAAKALESAGALAKEAGKFDEVLSLYKRASDLYIECGMPQPAADALVRGARALEDANPDEALRFYINSCEILEEEGKESMAFETYRAAMGLYIKKERFLDAANVLLRWGLAADKTKAVHSQCKAYLSAIIVYLYTHDLKQAEQCYSDCSQVDAFINNDHGTCAYELLKAYQGGDAEDIKHVVKASSVIKHLDHLIVRLAKKLPTGDVAVLGSGNDEQDDLT